MGRHKSVSGKAERDGMGQGAHARLGAEGVSQGVLVTCKEKQANYKASLGKPGLGQNLQPDWHPQPHGYPSKLIGNKTQTCPGGAAALPVWVESRAWPGEEPSHSLGSY